MCMCVFVKWVVSIRTILNPLYIKPFIQVDGVGAEALRTDVHMAIKQYFFFLVIFMASLTQKWAKEVKLAKVWAQGISLLMSQLTSCRETCLISIRGFERGFIMPVNLAVMTGNQRGNKRKHADTGTDLCCAVCDGFVLSVSVDA